MSALGLSHKRYPVPPTPELELKCLPTIIDGESLLFLAPCIAKATVGLQTREIVCEVKTHKARVQVTYSANVYVFPCSAGHGWKQSFESREAYAPRACLLTQSVNIVDILAQAIQAILSAMLILKTHPPSTIRVSN